ncbi:helix-turn-helix domain-containing protein [Nocardia tengchongensis]|uniref:helix-turn-helix domain-containing protein n=1 Tax=Nocardia tengchongensis TaxID=2055889 RepID=UPI003663C255
MSRTVLHGFNRHNLRSARKKRGYTAADLARLADVGVATLLHWEDGSTTPQAEGLLRVARALDIPMTRLIVVPEKDRYPSYYRQLLGLGQARLADIAGMPTSTLQSIERGEAALGTEKAAALAVALGIPEQVLLEAYERVRLRKPGTRA